MFYDFRRTNKILNELGISPNQAYFCILLLEQDFNYKKELFDNYINKNEGIDFIDINKLEELGYIENCSNNNILKTIGIEKKYKYAGNTYKVDYKKTTDIAILELFIVTPKFKDSIYIDAEVAAEELLKVYPSWIFIENKRQSLKIIPDREEFYQYYNTIINGDILKHKFIVEMFSRYRKLIDDNKINGMGIKKALESRFWEEIEKLTEEEESDKNSYNKKSR